jgi:hypothetical protein
MSQTRVKREVTGAAGKTRRSVWPRAPKHGKHSDVQGFPNNRGLKGK